MRTARSPSRRAPSGTEIPVADPHHALDDALVTAQLFLVTAAKLGERGLHSVAELADAAPPAPLALRRARPPW